MFNSNSRRLLVVSTAMMFSIIPGGCLGQDGIGSLIDLAASASGSLVQIFVQAGLNHVVNQPQDSPDLDAPISEQEH